LGRALDEALQAGDALLRLLGAPAEAVEMEQVEALVAQRAAALSQVGTGAPAPDLDRLHDQQRLLERQLGALLASLREVKVGAQAVRHQVQGVNRLLDPGPRSRLLNTTR
jgi:uncharacterized protein involved in type VI secretion and phage assembly